MHFRWTVIATVPACTFPRTITVPAGHVYLLGDNRGASDDSRFWGAVPVAQVLGRYARTVSR
jgi:signal peptidase I